MGNISEMKQIGKRAVAGIIWRGGYQVFHQVASFSVKIILVKILLPEDFGMIAMAMIVFTSLDIINRFCGGEPFIQDCTSDPDKAKNTLFYLNLFFIGSTILIGFFSAPYISLFFLKKLSESQSITVLELMIKIFALRLSLSIFAAVPMAILIKSLKFRELYSSNAAGTCVYIISAPILAYLDFGIWAIVFAHILEQAVITFLFLCYAPFAPKLIFDKDIAKKYITYNSNIFFISVTSVIITQGDDTVIGRLFGPVTLGYYNIGQQFAMLSSLIVLSNFNEIFFPIFSKLQNEKEKFKKVFFRVYRLTLYLSFPLIGGSIVLSREIVLFFLGEKWLPMLPVFYILSISMLISSLVSTADAVFRSLNLPKINRNSKFIQLVGFIFLIYPFSITWGYLGVCWVMVIISAMPVIYLIPKLSKLFDGLYAHIFNVLAKSVGFTILMVIAVYLFKSQVPGNKISIVLSVIVGIVVYTITLIRFDTESKNDIQNLFSLIREKMKFGMISVF